MEPDGMNSRPIGSVKNRITSVCVNAGHGGAAFAAGSTGGEERKGPPPAWALRTPYDREIAGMALPAMLAGYMEPLQSAVNAALVGHLGTQQLGALSLGTLAMAFATSLFYFLLALTVPEVAAAASRNDANEVSDIAAKTLWVALFFGSLMAAALQASAGSVVAALRPPEASVATYAVQYINARSWGVVPVLLGFACTGVYRGLKDTRLPLFASALGATTNVLLNYIFLYVLNWGVAGTGAAASMAQALSTSVLLGTLVFRGRVKLSQLLRPPPLASVLPMLQQGSAITARSVVSFGTVLYVSAICIRLGSVHQAAFEVTRQLWSLTSPLFDCVNVAAQSLLAAALGKRDVPLAKALLSRLMVLASGMGLLAGTAVWALKEPLVTFFTSDPRVFATVMTVLPLLCVCFSLDAATIVMEGSLMAGRQSNYLSAIQVAASALQYAVATWLAGSGRADLLAVWTVFKMPALLRLGGCLLRNYGSAQSAYREASSSEGVQPAVAVAAVAGPPGPASQLPDLEPPAVPARGVKSAAAPLDPPAVAVAVAVQDTACSSSSISSDGDGALERPSVTQQQEQQPGNTGISPCSGCAASASTNAGAAAQPGRSSSAHTHGGTDA